MGTENVDQRTHRRPKDTQATKGQDGHVSHLSLSLFCVAYASSIHSSSSRKKRRCRITRPKKARRILPPSRFSRFALSRWWCCFIRASERTKKARIIRSGRKKNKQTKDEGETKNLKKCQRRGIFQRAKSGRGDFRGFLASFVHKKIKGKRTTRNEFTLLIRIR